MQALDPLPSDSYGVHVENDTDHRRLLWVLNRIGEQKVRKSSDKYKSKNNGAAIYISTLLQWYQLKVPSTVYAEKYIKTYCVYVLVSNQCSVMKVGMTGSWPARAFAFAKQTPFRLHKIDELLQTIDIGRSTAVHTSSEKIARSIESAVLSRFKSFKVQPPFESHLKGYGVRTSRECLSSEIYADLVDFLHAVNLLGSTEGNVVLNSETLSAALDRWLPLLDVSNSSN